MIVMEVRASPWKHRSYVNSAGEHVHHWKRYNTGGYHVGLVVWVDGSTQAHWTVWTNVSGASTGIPVCQGTRPFAQDRGLQGMAEAQAAADLQLLLAGWSLEGEVRLPELHSELARIGQSAVAAWDALIAEIGGEGP